MPERLTTSIAMATYNGAKYLQEQLDSFVRQTVLPDELIITDDCSTDDTVAICERFADSAPFPVRLHQNDQNLGFTRNFEKALEKCTGDIVFLSDQDDVWYSNKIERVLQAFALDQETALIIHDLEYCDTSLQRNGQTKIDRIRTFADPSEVYVTGMATAIRSGFLRKCLPFPKGIEGFSAHDSWLHSCAFLIDKKKLFNEVLADYRRHETNATIGGNLNVPKLNSPNELKAAARRTLYSPTPLEKMKNAAARDKALLSWFESHYQNNLSEATCQTRRRLTKKVEANARRVELLEVNRFRRIGLVFNMYTRGDYNHFSGIRSAFKDIVIN